MTVSLDGLMRLVCQMCFRQHTSRKTDKHLTIPSLEPMFRNDWFHFEGGAAARSWEAGLSSPLRTHVGCRPRPESRKYFARDTFTPAPRRGRPSRPGGPSNRRGTFVLVSATSTSVIGTAASRVPATASTAPMKYECPRGGQTDPRTVPALDFRGAISWAHE